MSVCLFVCLFGWLVGWLVVCLFACLFVCWLVGLFRLLCKKYETETSIAKIQDVNVDTFAIALISLEQLLTLFCLINETP